MKKRAHIETIRLFRVKTTIVLHTETPVDTFLRVALALSDIQYTLPRASFSINTLYCYRRIYTTMIGTALL